MDGGDYRKERLFTVERLSATLLVAVWVAIAFRLGGHGLAVRAAVLFMVPLTMVWIPAVIARTALRDSHWKRDFLPKPAGFVVRIIGWLVILGVPLAWLVFFGMAT